MKRVFKWLLSLPFLLATIALMVYALGGFVIAPWWIKRELPQILKSKLSATGSVGEIAINPFKFTVDVRDFALTESGGDKPALAFERLFVDFEASSLFHRAWTFADITLEAPRVNLETDASGALNLTKLVPRDAAPKKDAPAELPRLLLQKLALKQGHVTFTDKALATTATATLTPVTFDLQDLSTLPDQRGEYALSARLPAGGTLGWRGAVSLAPIASTGQIEFKAMKLATLWQFVQNRLRIDEPGGQATLSLQYNVRYAESRLDASTSAMSFSMNDITLRQKGASDAALTAGEFALSGGTFNLAKREIQFPELTLAKIVANTLIDAEGKTNWAQLIAPPAPLAPLAAAATDKPTPGAPWQFGIAAINVSDVRLRVVDQGFVRPLAVDIARAGLRTSLKASIGAENTAVIDNIAVDLADIRVAEAGAKDSLITLATASLSDGAFDLAQKKFFANAVKLSKPVTAILRDASGVINLATAFARKPAKLPEPSTITTEFSSIELTDGAIAFQDRAIEPALALDFHSIRFAAKNISSGTTNAVPFDAALQIRQGGTVRAQGNAAPGQQRASVKLEANNIALAPLAALIEKHSTFKLLSGVAQAAGQLDWSGQGNAAGIRYAGSAGLDDVRWAADATAPTAASATGASLRAQGTVSTGEQRASLKVEARNVALMPLANMVAKHTTLKLVSGVAYAAGQLDWDGRGKAPGIRYAGNAGVDDFRLDPEAGSERLVALKGLLAEGIQVDSVNRQARIDDVRLSGPSGRIAIAKDKTTNFTGVMRQPADAPASTSTAANEAPYNINVERVHVSNGELDFSDQSLVLPFAALIREFTGTVTGLSTQPGTRAGLKLEGRVDEFGQAQIGGTLNPFEPKAFTDITVNFRNVAMSPLTPYSATFAGRRIASGKLSLDLQYKLNNSQLLGENKILLEQFTLGERVASPTAINLPLDLAIALLTDSDGKIDLSVPVRGNVDSPEFSYGPIVWQAIRTVLTNIVTAPFRALASLFGSGADKVDAIGFAAGRAQLAPPEREKLTRVAGVLKQRPGLRLVVEGRYDTRYDGAALRSAAARRALAERQGIKLAGDDDPALANFDNAKTQRAIEAMLEERAGKDSIDKFKVGHEKTTGKPVSRVNPALALIGRGSPDRQFYEAMFNQVIELQPLDKDALQSLATQRSTAVMAFLKASTGLDVARVGSKAVAQVNAEKAAEITTALSMDAAKTIN